MFQEKITPGLAGLQLLRQVAVGAAQYRTDHVRSATINLDGACDRQLRLVAGALFGNHEVPGSHPEPPFLLPAAITMFQCEEGLQLRAAQAIGRLPYQCDAVD